MNNMSFENTMDDYDYNAFDEIADGIIDTIIYVWITKEILCYS